MGTSGTPPQYVIVHRSGAFFYSTRFIWQQCPVWQYHSDLSDQSALEIRVRIRVRLELHYFSIFNKDNETSTLSSANFTEGNILQKERTQTMNNIIKLHFLGVPMNKLGN